MKVLTRWFFATGPNLFIYLNAWFRENRCRSPDWKTSIEYMQGSRNAIWVMDKNERTRARWSFRWTVQSKRILIKISKKPKEIYTKEKPNMIEVEGIVSVAQCLITTDLRVNFLLSASNFSWPREHGILSFIAFLSAAGSFDESWSAFLKLINNSLMKE